MSNYIAYIFFLASGLITGGVSAVLLVLAIDSLNDKGIAFITVALFSFGAAFLALAVSCFDSLKKVCNNMKK